MSPTPSVDEVDPQHVRNLGTPTASVARVISCYRSLGGRPNTGEKRSSSHQVQRVRQWSHGCARCRAVTPLATSGLVSDAAVLPGLDVAAAGVADCPISHGISPKTELASTHSGQQGYAPRFQGRSAPAMSGRKGHLHLHAQLHVGLAGSSASDRRSDRSRCGRPSSLASLTSAELGRCGASGIGEPRRSPAPSSEDRPGGALRMECRMQSSAGTLHMESKTELSAGT